MSKVTQIAIQQTALDTEQPIVRASYGSPNQPLQIGEVLLECYVLEDGRRVFSQTGMVKGLDMKSGSASNSVPIGNRLTKFIAGKALQPYISEELAYKLNNPIKFRPPSTRIAYGYEATILVDICEAILEAQKDGKLNWQQEHIAKRCEILWKGFARVGIIALVDEATGYQEARDRNALYKILDAYIAKELLPWTKRFPDEFYKEMFRLRGWQYSPLTIQKPKYVGKLTNEIVYERLPDGVIEELQRKNPVVKDGRRRYKHHQFLTEDIGNPHLEKHLAVVTALMRASTNWRNFEALLERAIPKKTTHQPTLPNFSSDDED